MKKLYAKHMTLLTDLYQLTMAYGYWKSGKAEDEAVFNLFFRKLPFGGGYAVACGLEYVIDFINDFHFDDNDLAYLGSLTGNNGQPLFDVGFLDYLSKMHLTCDIHALEEGTPVFPNEPVLRVTGPIIQCQLLETALLNIINFQTLIATKSARICLAAKDDPVVEFGLRRAQGCDGAIAATRAAYVGGCAATSNVMAGHLHGIPIKGTHAHSWVMSFEDEKEAFETYAEVLPNNCIFLVDTYETVEGVKNAVAIGRKLRENGHEMVGIRLDSGDLTDLSIKARKILDDAGFPDAQIVASNDLDEYAVEKLKNDGARIDIWGIGTKLITAYDQPALGGVYKISAIRQVGGSWRSKIKLSNDQIKISTPGIQQTRRFSVDSKFFADAIYDEGYGIGEKPQLVDYFSGQPVEIPAGAEYCDLLIPIFLSGKCVYRTPQLDQTRLNTLSQLDRLPADLTANCPKGKYIIALEKQLDALKKQLIEAAQ